MTSSTKKMIRPVHPFPARMAPDLAFARLKRVPSGALVLDPMSGSGTVLRQASELGHRSIGFDMDPLAVLMTKVWTILRRIRSDSIGAERGSKLNDQLAQIEAIQKSMGLIEKLPSRHKLMVSRYARDIRGMMSEVARVLRPEGKAILVVGNSCLKNVFINNAGGIVKAASQVGLKLVSSTERELPDSKRYLPMPSKRTAALGRRMRTETILTFGVKS
jgi:hypothetical protein